ncbi:MAG: LuxR C-terminal-related transcriptional regulator [Spirochaetales bacterium]|nr:LuxR C-terminal-related transcriptional regulator [Spirochaetales bacterium]
MEKSEEMEYITQKLRLFSKSEFNNYVDEAPLTNKEKDFLVDISRGYTYEELARINHVKTATVSYIKRKIFKKLYNWENRQIVLPFQNERIDASEVINQKIEEAFKSKEEELKQKEAILNKYIEKETKKKIDEKLQKIKKSQNLNTRGTKKAEPEIVLDKTIQDDIKEMSVVELKKKYIPMYARHEISAKELCNIFGHSIQWATRIKRRYLEEGEKCTFERKRTKSVSPNKTSDEIANKIINLYSTNYRQFSIAEFTKILKVKFNINLCEATVSRILREKGLKSPTADKYLGQSKESLGIDYYAVMEIFHSSVNKMDYSEIEEYGLVQICDLAFIKAYSSLNSISKKKFKLKFRTSYSLFEYFIDNGYLNIRDFWSYWNNNHDKFSYIYNKPTRYKVIQDIKYIYFPMFRIIEEYIREMKKSLVEYTKELI